METQAQQVRSDLEERISAISGAHLDGLQAAQTNLER
jgi:hypothetical protein